MFVCVYENCVHFIIVFSVHLVVTLYEHVHIIQYINIKYKKYKNIKYSKTYKHKTNTKHSLSTCRKLKATCVTSCLRIMEISGNFKTCTSIPQCLHFLIHSMNGWNWVRRGRKFPIFIKRVRNRT